MRQWQPDRADLLPTGGEAVDDAPGDDEVRAGVVMRQCQAGRGVMRGGSRADDES